MENMHKAVSICVANIKVNLPIIKLKGMIIISVLSLDFTMFKFLTKFWLCKILIIKNAHNLLKTKTIVKKTPSKNTDNSLTL